LRAAGLAAAAFFGATTALDFVRTADFFAACFPVVTLFAIRSPVLKCTATDSATGRGWV